MEGIGRDHPDFVLGAGDLTYADEGVNGPGAADIWANDIMRYYSTWAPLMPTPGNHDSQPADQIRNYKGRFALPGQSPGSAQPAAGSGDYYSFTYGPVYIVALPEMYVSMKPGSPFRAWLDADLRTTAADPDIKWRIAFSHRPFYSTGTRHGPDQTYLNLVRPALERYRFDLVISGHEHQYERTAPMLNGVARSVDRNAWTRGTGIAYVVTGGGGAPLYNDFGPAQPWDAVRKTVHEHLSVEVDGAGAALRVTGIDDSAPHRPFDQFVITDCATSVCGPSGV
jgi:hypothetical protein